MVDALHQAHRAVRQGGTIIDLRPDSRNPPKVMQRGRVVGGLYERRDAIVDNRFSDRAVQTLVREGLLTPIRRGLFWYDLPPLDRAGLDEYVATSPRIGGYARGTRSALRRYPDRPIVVRRALTYGIYRRV